MGENGSVIRLVVFGVAILLVVVASAVLPVWML